MAINQLQEVSSYAEVHSPEDREFFGVHADGMRLVDFFEMLESVALDVAAAAEKATSSAEPDGLV